MSELLKKTITNDEVVIYQDEGDRYHHPSQPAITWPGGTEMWFKHGKFHRDGGPAILRTSDYEAGIEWWYDGVTFKTVELYASHAKLSESELIELKLIYSGA